MKTLKVYVGCGLTHASEEFKAKVEEFKEKLRSIPDVEVLCFLGLKDSTNFGVYMHDIHNCVYQCDLLIAICDEPSIGLGYEMATQIEARKKPCLALGHSDSKITRLVLDPRLKGYYFYRYLDLCGDAYEMAKIQIAEIRARMSTPKRMKILNVSNTRSR